MPLFKRSSPQSGDPQGLPIIGDVKFSYLFRGLVKSGCCLKFVDDSSQHGVHFVPFCHKWISTPHEVYIVLYSYKYITNQTSRYFLELCGPQLSDFLATCGHWRATEGPLRRHWESNASFLKASAYCRSSCHMAPNSTCHSYWMVDKSYLYIDIM